ncbi:MAG: hypothetical protein ACOX9C_10235 [Kiritimatiellia bacterium]|jgi:hypothetical protein
MRPRFRVCLLSLSILLGAEDAHARLFRADNGDHRLVGIKLELQAGRSHCAPATMAAALNYHGIATDQRALTNAVGRTSETGTDVESMLEQVTPLSAKHGLQVETLIGFDYARYRHTILAYNRLARKAGRKRLWFMEQEPLDLAKTFARADIDLLRQTFGRRERAAFRSFVRDTIDADAPLIWGVVLGIAHEPELPEQSRGGHLRLIIGYNAKTDEILYADPWGPGHALKRMPQADALAITMSLHRLKATQDDH